MKVRRVCRQHGSCRSRYVAKCLILLPRKCSVIKVCCQGLSQQQANCWWELSSQQGTSCWELSSQQINSTCWLESSSQQVACWQESSRQQNFMAEHFLGNKFFWPVTNQKEAGHHVRLPGSWPKNVVAEKVLNNKILLTRTFWQEATCWWELSSQHTNLTCCLENAQS